MVGFGVSAFGGLMIEATLRSTSSIEAACASAVRSTPWALRIVRFEILPSPISFWCQLAISAGRSFCSWILPR